MIFSLINFFNQENMDEICGESFFVMRILSKILLHVQLNVLITSVKQRYFDFESGMVKPCIL